MAYIIIFTSTIHSPNSYLCGLDTTLRLLNTFQITIVLLYMICMVSMSLSPTKVGSYYSPMTYTNSWSITVPYKYMPQTGFEPPLLGDTSYEADALRTKPPRLNLFKLCKTLH